MKVNAKTAAVTHIYDGEEMVSALTMDGQDNIWLATFGCARLAAQFVRILKMLGVIDVPVPDYRQFVGKSKAA